MNILIFLLGVTFGVIVHLLYVGVFSAKATFQIDHSNLEKTIFRLDIDNVEDFDSRNYLIMKINHNANLSQK